jgi:hypothetical protein
MRSALILLLILCINGFGMVRMAVIIGNNFGLEEDKPLQFATRDAQQVFDVMSQLGGIDAGRGYLLLDPDVSKALTAFDDARRRISGLRAEGQKVQLLIYYSGHGSEEALHMNGEELPLARIRGFFHDMDADLKILIADACFSGSLIQAKGGTLSDPVPVKYQDELKVNGSAILTSSSAGELSQESKELQGSLFTHYFLTAIRGAADSDRDGTVSLWEAYNYTQAGLRRKLISVKNVTQNPEFDMDLHGSENVVLTRVNLGQAFLGLKKVPLGRYQVMESVGALQIAEVNVSDPDGVTLALPKGSYVVYRSDGPKGVTGYADLRSSRSVDLGPGDFVQAQSNVFRAKGFDAESGPIERADGYRLVLGPRWYTSFPGRQGSGAFAYDVSAERPWRDWGTVIAFSWLQPWTDASPGGGLRQDGYGVAAEGRYYLGYSSSWSAHAGPRVEAWSLGQTFDGKVLTRGDVAAALACAGIEKTLGRGFSFSAGAGAGAFWSSTPAGTLKAEGAFPFSLGLRYGR